MFKKVSLSQEEYTGIMFAIDFSTHFCDYVKEHDPALWAEARVFAMACTGIKEAEEE